MAFGIVLTTAVDFVATEFVLVVVTFAPTEVVLAAVLLVVADVARFWTREAHFTATLCSGHPPKIVIVSASDLLESERERTQVV